MSDEHKPGDLVNLNRARKDRARAEARALADDNAAKFGRTKAERVLEASRHARARSVLDQHLLDDE